LVEFCANEKKSYDKVKEKLKSLGVLYEKNHRMKDSEGESTRGCFLNILFEQKK
jgi:hypothetical protein